MLPFPVDTIASSIHSVSCWFCSWHQFFKNVSSQEKQTKEALTRKQQKGKKKGPQEEESQDATELLKRPKEYTVKFTFPNPPPLSPPILGLHSKKQTIIFRAVCSQFQVQKLFQQYSWQPLSQIWNWAKHRGKNWRRQVRAHYVIWLHDPSVMMGTTVSVNQINVTE